MTPALRTILFGGLRPVLSLDFANGVYRNASGSWSNPADVGLTCTRSTVANDVTSGGVILPFAANVPRIVPGRGLGVWEARTQRFILPRAAATQSISLPSTGSYTLTVWGSGSVAISAGTATITGAGTATNGSAVTVNCTATGTVTCTVTGSPTFVQLEAGTVGSPPIDAAASATTCNADVNTITGRSISDGFTVVAEVELPTIATSTFPQVWQLDNGATSNIAGVYAAASSARVYSAVLVGGSVQTDRALDAGAYTRGAVSRFASRFGALSRRGARDGVLGAADTDDLALPVLTRLGIGVQTTGGQPFNGYIRSLVIYPTPFSDARLQAVTA